MTKVSIIVPVYNVVDYLSDCLESLVKQTLDDIEIICVNDGSTDSSLIVLEKYEKQYDFIKIINQRNKGLASARNAGIAAAKGEYLGFVDSDDWIDTEFYEKLYEAAKRHNTDIAAASIVRKREHSQKFRINYFDEEIFFDIQDKISACNVPEMCYVWNKIYKKSFLDNNSLIFADGKNFEDIRFTIRALYYSKSLVTVPDIYYYYRVRKNSIVKTLSNEMISARAESLNDMFEFADLKGIMLDNRFRCFTVKIVYLAKIMMLKIKQYRKEYRYYLFGFIPIFKKTI